MNKADYNYKTIVILNAERKKKLDYICEKEVRNKTNMIAVLIDNHYQELQKKENNEGYIQTPINKDFDPYEEFLKLRGSGWDGDLEKSRANREFE